MTAFLLFLAFWVFFVGSAFGSFLNVVVWRLPQGMNLSFPLSHCPKCGKPIRRRHNIPVLGWLLLRGKCYDCGQKISRRYPTVEFICGCGFLVIFWGIWPGVVLSLTPHSGMYTSAERSFYIFLMLATSLADAALFLTILGTGLIILDENRVPWKIFLPFWILWGLFWGGLFVYIENPYILKELGGVVALYAVPSLAMCMIAGWRLYAKNRAVLAMCLLGVLLTAYGLSVVTINLTLIILSFVWLLTFHKKSEEISSTALALPIFSLLSVIVLKSLVIHIFWMSTLATLG